jgi:hypothetical protein
MRAAVLHFARVAARVRAEVWPVCAIIPAQALTSITGAASTDIITKASHGLSTGDRFQFTALTGGAGLTINTRYWVIRLDANTFSLATTKALATAGTAIDFTTNISTASGNPEYAIAKSAMKDRRYPQEQGAGFIHETWCTFNFPATGPTLPAVGVEIQITESELSDEVNTLWRCEDVTRSAAGTEHRCQCKRQD